MWPGLANEAFDLRTQAFSVTDSDTALVEAIRSVGGGASLAGSGGAVVGHLPDPALVEPAMLALGEIGAEALVPTIAPPT